MKADRGVKWFIPPSEELVLRTSLIRTFLRCPAQALFRYFKGLIVLPNSMLTFGSCGHKTAEYQNRYKHKKGRDAKLSTLQDVFHEEFKGRRKKTKWLKGENQNKLEVYGTDLVVPVYYRDLAKKTEPLKVEEPFKLRLKKFNLVVTGTIDLVTTKRTITDYKFKKRAPRWNDGMNSTQGKTYQLGYDATFKRPSAGFALEGIVKKAAPETFKLKPYKMSSREEELFTEKIGQIAMQMRMGLFYPCGEGNYFCSKNWCGFWEICHKGAWRQLPVESRMFNMNTLDEEGEDED